MHNFLARQVKDDISESVDLERFSSKNFFMREDGTANLSNFKSSVPILKSLGMSLKGRVRLQDFDDRRGYFYDIASILNNLAKHYPYIGWAEMRIYGQPYIGFFVKE